MSALVALLISILRWPVVTASCPSQNESIDFKLYDDPSKLLVFIDGVTLIYCKTMSIYDGSLSDTVPCGDYTIRSWSIAPPTPTMDLPNVQNPWFSFRFWRNGDEVVVDDVLLSVSNYDIFCCLPLTALNATLILGTYTAYQNHNVPIEVVAVQFESETDNTITHQDNLGTLTSTLWSQWDPTKGLQFYDDAMLLTVNQ